MYTFSEWQIEIYTLIHDSIKWVESLFEQHDVTITGHTTELVDLTSKLQSQDRVIQEQTTELKTLTDTLTDLQKQVIILNNSLGIKTVFTQPNVSNLDNNLLDVAVTLDSPMLVQKLINANLIVNKSDIYYIKNTTLNTYNISDTTGAPLLYTPNSIISITLEVGTDNITKVTNLHLIAEIKPGLSSIFVKVPTFKSLLN